MFELLRFLMGYIMTIMYIVHHRDLRLKGEDIEYLRNTKNEGLCMMLKYKIIYD